MATIPLAMSRPVIDEDVATRPSIKLRREPAATSGWRHLLFGSGPFFYRLLRFAQRNSR